jgi:SulP family sulfate permease
VSPAARLRGLKPDWLSDPRVWRTEVPTSLAVALALIPEAISFSLIAGVDPAIGLFTSFTISVVISVVGGRRAAISAATGTVALVIAPLNRDHGPAGPLRGREEPRPLVEADDVHDATGAPVLRC